MLHAARELCLPVAIDETDLMSAGMYGVGPLHNGDTYDNHDGHGRSGKLGEAEAIRKRQQREAQEERVQLLGEIEVMELEILNTRAELAAAGAVHAKVSNHK